MDRSHDFTYPASITLDKFRGVVKTLGFGEEVIDVLDTILLSVCKKAILERAVTLGVAKDGIHSIV